MICFWCKVPIQILSFIWQFFYVLFLKEMTASECKLHSCYMPHSPTDTICTSMTIQSLNIQRRNKCIYPWVCHLTVQCAGKYFDSHHCSIVSFRCLRLAVWLYGGPTEIRVTPISNQSLSHLLQIKCHHYIF